MAGRRSLFGKSGAYAALAAFALTPSILLAVTAGDSGSSIVGDSFDRFTPAGVDSRLAEHFNLADFRDEEFSFTPAGKDDEERSVTIVVRAQGKAARYVRSADKARAGLVAARRDSKPVELGLTSYNLGAAKGIQSFTPDSASDRSKNRDPRLVSAATPDASVAVGNGGGFRLDRKERESLAGTIGSSRTAEGMPRATSGLAERRTDLEGSLNVTKGVAVTAGVRVDNEENSMRRLTDDQRDNQAVYVGTLIKF